MIGFIGAGNMARAIANGVVKSGVKASDIGVYDVDFSRYAAFPGAVTYTSSAELIEKEEIIVFSVKPQVLGGVLEEISDVSVAGKTFVSICAAISTSYINSFLPDAHVVRAMPNTPMLYGKGVCALSRAATVTDAEFERVLDLFDRIGTTLVIPEEKQDAIISVTGSSPAYLFALADAMAKSAQEEGFSYAESVKWIADVFEGAAAMLKESGMSPEELCRMVCSPGGTTLAAMDVFEKEKLDETVKKAMKACTKRARELAK